MATVIILKYGDAKRLEKLINASQPTIRKAIRGEYNPNNEEELRLALEIRSKALEIGGVEIKGRNR